MDLFLEVGDCCRRVTCDDAVVNMHGENKKPSQPCRSHAHQNCRNLCNKLHKVNSLPAKKLTKIIMQMMRKLTLSLHSSRKWRMTPSHSPKLKRTGTGHTGKKPWMRRSLHLTMLAHEAMSQGQHTRIS